MLGLIRLSHPFPSLLNALATGAIALIAGGGPATALRLGTAMLALQASIGAVNDLVDAASDAVAKPAKPIPTGAVTPSIGRVWAVAALGLGLLLAVPSGAATVAVAALGVGLGYMYDLRLSRTALSWLPLALALPLLPVFGWLGARGELPSTLLALFPVAVLAGAALLVANGLVDLERDATSGKPTIAVRIGRGRAWLLHTVAFAAAIALALALAPVVPAAPGADEGAPLGLRLAWSVGVPLGVVVIGIGAGLMALVSPALRERGWELEGIGTAILGLGWLAGAALAASGGAGH